MSSTDQRSAAEQRPRIETAPDPELGISFPAGQYLSLSGRIHPGSGGQTRALLLRNRLFAQWAGVEPVLLSMDDAPDYPRIRQTLREQGLLVDPMRLLNLFEWYRDTSVDHLEPSGGLLADVEGFDRVDVPHPDGTIHQTRYVQRHGGQSVIVDYRRADGSVFLRVPAGSPATASPATDVILVNSRGVEVGRWPTQRGWRKSWIRNLLVPDRRTFLICDSRFAIADILPLSDPRLHIIHVMHNVHLKSPYHWSSAVLPQYRPLLESVRHLDGLVTLTERQRQDVADRFGATTNMYVVPNPVESPPAPPSPPVRDPKRFVMLTRLENQKRLEDAVRAFALVVRDEPDARLDIFGAGRLRGFVQDEITSLGVSRAVVLHGHDPAAQEALRTATGLLVTSRFEGYPLATLESMSRGCPVVSYDIKYGPREQITDGVDGFLVGSGELRSLADRVLQLIRDPALTARMSEAAVRKAHQHDHRAFLADWGRVLEQVIAARAQRTALESVELRVSRLGYRRSQRLPDGLARGPVLSRLTGRRSASAGFRRAPKVEFAGVLKVEEAAGALARPEQIVLTLDAVDEKTGSIVPLPLLVRRSGTRFRLSSGFDPGEVFGAGRNAARTIRLRLRLVWNNSAWETTLTRPGRLAPNYELSYAGNGELTLMRGPHAPG